MEGSTPLADYFWIAGVESISYDDPLPPSQPVESTIVEDGEPDEAPTNGQSRPTARHSRQNSGNRLSKLSFDNRFSIGTLEELDGNTRSNRSSATIRPSNANAGTTSTESGAFPGEFDFDKALIKFAAEREDFLDDLSFSAGAKVQAKPMINPRAERIRADENVPSGRLSPLKSIKGSFRRKMSFREMNSVRKVPGSVRAGNVGNRACKSL